MLNDFMGKKNARLGGGLRECPMRSGRESTLTKQTVVVGTICDSGKPDKLRFLLAVTRDICHYKLEQRLFLFFRINILKDCKKIQCRQHFAHGCIPAGARCGKAGEKAYKTRVADSAPRSATLIPPPSFCSVRIEPLPG